MRNIVKTGALALMLLSAASNALAAASGGCARPEDMNALKSAAIQQRLMVAALTCNAVTSYNTFVTAYRKELQAADRALQNYFRRLIGAAGTEKYHAYKTHLANASSMQSIGNILDFCASTQASFDASTANAAAKAGLKTFVDGQDLEVEETYKPCEVRTASAAAPAKVPFPRLKPEPAPSSAQTIALPVRSPAGGAGKP